MLAVASQTGNPCSGLILPECRLLLFEAKPPQPTSEVPGGAPAPHRAMILVETT